MKQKKPNTKSKNKTNERTEKKQQHMMKQTNIKKTPRTLTHNTNTKMKTTETAEEEEEVN